MLWLDGAYGWVPGQGQPVFRAQPEVTDADVQLLVQRIRVRVLRALRKAGKWVDEDAAADADGAPADDRLPGLAAAAVAGRAAFGARAGRRDGRVGGDGRWQPQAKGPLCAEMDGFSLHANTWVAPRDRDRLEALCRYAARPAVSESRLAELPDGRIGYALKRRYRDGTTAVVMTNEVLMERLCALVPPPRKHLVTYHGALAPAAGLRPKVVPRQTVAGAAAGCRHGASDGGVSEAAGADNAATPATSAIAAVCRQQAERGARARLRAPHRGGQSRSRRQRLPWADLLRRTFGIDVLVCPQCAGPRRVLAAIHDPAAIARVLGALGLTAAGADPAGCRAPPAAAGFDAADEGNAAE
ncbi:MAG: transposase [Burkholderiaceae bacterium]